MTYAELVARAERFARRLRAAGAGPERVVALLLPRSADLVVAELAVAWTGAAHLPLHPDWPAERIRAVLATVGAVALVRAPDADTRTYGPVPVLHPPAASAPEATAVPQAPCASAPEAPEAPPAPASPAPARVRHVHLGLDR